MGRPTPRVIFSAMGADLLGGGAVYLKNLQKTL